MRISIGVSSGYLYTFRKRCIAVNRKKKPNVTGVSLNLMTKEE